jgi:DNA-binding NtrC family response regulator
VGADRPEHHSARVVLATHRDLEAACDAGTFRRDLYERLDFAQIHVPPLNARRMDVLLLARHFFEARRSNAFHAQPSLVLDALFALDWTNRNVRGLRNIVAGAVIAGGEIDLFALTLRRGRHRRADPNTVRFDPHAEDWSTVEARTRKAYIEALLVVCGHNRTLAAARYGVARSTFYVLLKELGIT